MGEVESIRQRISNKNDYKVPLTGLRAGTFVEPPIETVLSIPFWTSATYESLRRRLAKPVPTITVMMGGDYITINSQSGQTTVHVEADNAEESQVFLGLLCIVKCWGHCEP